jgi:hypothetical protein
MVDETIMTGLSGKTVADINCRIAGLKRLKSRLDIAHIGLDEYNRQSREIDREVAALLSLTIA